MLDRSPEREYDAAMLAQVSGETARGFIERLPDILRAAATNPLGLVALIVLSFSLLAFFLFKNSRDKIKLTVLYVVAGCVLVLAVLVIHQWNERSVNTGGGAATACNVSGYVYNEDIVPAAGMQNVKLAYVAASPANSPPVQIATTSPNGHFSFNCSQINPDAFPIHLRAAYSGSGASTVIESDDTLLFGENTEVNLYVSPRAVSNHYRLNNEIMRIPSNQLLRNNYSTLTDAAAATARLPTNGVVAIPKNVRIPKETITRLRMPQ